jgi:hypothetical protein
VNVLTQRQLRVWRCPVLLPAHVRGISDRFRINKVIGMLPSQFLTFVGTSRCSRSSSSKVMIIS